ncbi:hypothetical protein L204_106184 [Cryptococcus depauperatus]
MTLLPTFHLVSVSASQIPARFLGSALIPLAASSITSFRYASSSAQRLNTPQKSKLQLELEQKLEEQKQMFSRMERANPGIDLAGSKLPIIEPCVDPPRLWSDWISFGKSNDKAYETARADREKMTRQSIGNMISQGGLDEYKNSVVRQLPGPLINAWVGIRGAGAMSKTVKQLTEMYNKYMQIQASGTMGQALSISTDDALIAAQNVIRGRKDNLTWELDKENKRPRLISARITVVDPRDGKMAAQVTLAFDTQQSLIIQKGNSAPTRRTQRVFEIIVFENRLGSNEGWKLKGKLTPNTSSA